MNKKVKNVILAIVLLVIICYIINFVHNLVIFSNIFNSNIAYLESSNVYYESSTNLEPNNTTKYYKLNQLEKIEYTEDNVVNQIQWFDYNNNEFLNIYPQEQVANSYTEEPEKHNLPLLLVNEEDNTFANKLMKSAWAFISTKNIDGTDCYVISDGMQTYYIEKDTGLPVQVEQIININNQDENVVITYNNWQLNSLSEDDMAKPDTSNYTGQ